MQQNGLKCSSSLFIKKASPQGTNKHLSVTSRSQEIQEYMKIAKTYCHGVQWALAYECMVGSNKMIVSEKHKNMYEVAKGFERSMLMVSKYLNKISE